MVPVVMVMRAMDDRDHELVRVLEKALGPQALARRFVARHSSGEVG